MILFECNPALNTKCPKTCCQTVCFDTRYQEFAKLNDNENPIISYISTSAIDELSKEDNDDNSTDN